ncbi:MAG: RNHCP domain-containing protein [Anaerolineaceae bacterium]|nr:RNHCP domain-containing protein [Anaerolineaceae bacterium]
MRGVNSRKEKYYYDEPFACVAQKQSKRTSRRYFEASFKCQHCGVLINADPLLSGVQNRNHCPYCLWSRHVDLYQAGDRLCACRADMRPMGLTLKQSRNKYTQQAGELMLVHQCEGCDAFSINRVAADDIADWIVDCYQVSLSITEADRQTLLSQGITLLGRADDFLLMRRLFGMEKEKPIDNFPI